MLVKINRSQILDWMASKSPRNIQPISSLGIFLDLTRPYLDRRNRKNDLVSISITIFYEMYFSNTLTTMKVAKSRAMSRTEFIFLIFLIWGQKNSGSLSTNIYFIVKLSKSQFIDTMAKTGWTLRNSVISSK